jgi:hypothetical protein
MRTAESAVLAFLSPVRNDPLGHPEKVAGASNSAAGGQIGPDHRLYSMLPWLRGLLSGREDLNLDRPALRRQIGSRPDAIA